MTTLAQIDQSASSATASTGRVTAPGNGKIAQVLISSLSGNLVSVRVSVSYNGNVKARPRVSLWSLANNLPSKELGVGTVSIDNKDIGLTVDIGFDPSIPLIAGAKYAIVVDYSGSRSSETFSWTATADVTDATRPCFIHDGRAWKAQSGLCDFISFGSVSSSVEDASIDSRGPVVS